MNVSPFADIASAATTWSGPAWLTAFRRSALDRFAQTGLPTTRLESWRTTPLPELGTRALSPGFASLTSEAQRLAEPFMGNGAVTLVFVDGFHSPILSTPEGAWPKGVRLAPMSTLLAGRAEDLRPWFEEAAGAGGALHDLNAAAFRDGASIAVENGVLVPVELRVVLVTTSADQPVGQHVRNLIQIGEGASLRLTIAVVGGPDALGFLNNHTRIRMAERARLDLVRVHESPRGVPHFDALSATLGPRATLNDTLLQTGSSWTRSEIDLVLGGDHATADLGGVFVARGTQVSDIHTVLSHEARGVTSRQNYRGLAADDARGVFHGQIRVLAEALGADATQNNRNMLLSKRAQVHSTPALEILTDDVKCKHGSATGQIDPAQLFYLRSRGLGLEEATRVLTRAFAGEVLSRLVNQGTRGLVEAQIAPSLEALGVAA